MTTDAATIAIEFMVKTCFWLVFAFLLSEFCRRCG